MYSIRVALISKNYTQGVRTAYVSRVLSMIIGLRGTKKAPIKGAWKISKLLPISIIPQVDIRFNRRTVPMSCQL